MIKNKFKDYVKKLFPSCEESTKQLSLRQ